jgi:hypothetical protein
MENKINWCGILQKNCPGKEKCDVPVCILLVQAGKWLRQNPNSEIRLTRSGGTLRIEKTMKGLLTRRIGEVPGPDNV